MFREAKNKELDCEATLRIQKKNKGCFNFDFKNLQKIEAALIKGLLRTF